ncbi:MAG TPA: alpha/beta hydrolase-fold protein [Anaerolineales bacterium]|jgi:enterochelin esterase-like enzyme|nr:alpha/beta hydrolase-fold protein [Anaerolineales bacterium]
MTRTRFLFLLSLFLGLSACTSPNPATPTPTQVPPTPTSTPTATPTIIPTATQLACLTQPGRVDNGSLDTTTPPQEFLIYLPPCYDQKTKDRYPVLYLLHGQTYTDDQWVRLGAATAADNLILSGTAQPFIIVFPDDRYWNIQAGSAFGYRLVHDLIPYIDENYRTLADRDYRALGGLSRGGGWAVELGLQDYELFGALGLNSPAIFSDDAQYLSRWIRAIPPDQWPRIWVDAGDQDKELSSVLQFEGLLSSYEIPHEWRMYTGDHSETYWHAHVTEYLQWYTDGWESGNTAIETQTPKP